jgi:hypothetical protein
MSPRPSRNGDVSETIHLTEKNFDEVLLTTDGLVMVDFWAESRRSSVTSLTGEAGGLESSFAGCLRSGLLGFSIAAFVADDEAIVASAPPEQRAHRQ